MSKFKAAVNRILIFAVSLSPLYATKKSAFVLAEYSEGQFRVIEKQNETMIAPVGSLLKPFAAWYLLEKGVKPDESVPCPPEQKRTARLRCWTPGGHGAMTIRTALAQSCNYYFLSRFLGLNLAEYEEWLRRRWDWPAELGILKPANVYGFDLSGGLEPAKLLTMYNSLIAAAEKGDASAVVVMSGLGQTCAGTLADFCRALNKLKYFRFLAGKTGTVVEGSRNFGIVFLYLEHLPTRKKILLLRYEKNKMGSEAAIDVPPILNAFHRKNQR